MPKFAFGAAEFRVPRCLVPIPVTPAIVATVVFAVPTRIFPVALTLFCLPTRIFTATLRVTFGAFLGSRTTKQVRGENRHD